MGITMRLSPRLYSYSYQRYGGKGTLAATKVAIRHSISAIDGLQPIGIGYLCFPSYYTTIMTIPGGWIRYSVWCAGRANDQGNLMSDINGI